MKHVELDASDPKKIAAKFLKQNRTGNVAHLFESVSVFNDAWQSTAGTAWCHLHDCACAVDRETQTDVYIAGPPCNPYSTQRSCRGSVGCWGGLLQHLIHPDQMFSCLCLSSLPKSPPVWKVQSGMKVSPKGFLCCDCLTRVTLLGGAATSLQVCSCSVWRRYASHDPGAE